MDAPVIDLDEFRTRTTLVPDDALAAVDEAWRTSAALEAQGHEVRFDLPRAGGRVVAELCDLSGQVVRAVSLCELVGWADVTAVAEA